MVTFQYSTSSVQGQEWVDHFRWFRGFSFLAWTVLLTSLFGPFASAALTTTSSLPLRLHLPTHISTCSGLEVCWTGGNPNYTLIAAESPSSAVLQSWGPSATTCVRWTVPVCGGTDVSFTLIDACGFQAATTIVVRHSADGSCLFAPQRTRPSCLRSSATTSTSGSAETTAANMEGDHEGCGPKWGPTALVVVCIVLLAGAVTAALFVLLRRGREWGRKMYDVAFRRQDNVPRAVRRRRDRARQHAVRLDLEMALETRFMYQRTSNSHLASHSSQFCPTPFDLWYGAAPKGGNAEAAEGVRDEGEDGDEEPPPYTSTTGCRAGIPEPRARMPEHVQLPSRPKQAHTFQSRRGRFT